MSEDFIAIAVVFVSGALFGVALTIQMLRFF